MMLFAELTYFFLLGKFKNYAKLYAGRHIAVEGVAAVQLVNVVISGHGLQVVAEADVVLPCDEHAYVRRADPAESHTYGHIHREPLKVIMRHQTDAGVDVWCVWLDLLVVFVHYAKWQEVESCRNIYSYDSVRPHFALRVRQALISGGATGYSPCASLQHQCPSVVEPIAHLCAVRLANVLEHLRVCVADVVHQSALQTELHLVPASTLTPRLRGTQTQYKKAKYYIASVLAHIKSLQSYEIFFKYANFTTNNFHFCILLLYFCGRLSNILNIYEQP